eukprot:29008-Pelagococcus_subviridis.AAC.2
MPRLKLATTQPHELEQTRVPRVPAEVIALACDLGELVHRGRDVHFVEIASALGDDREQLRRAPGRDDLPVQLDGRREVTPTAPAATPASTARRTMRTRGEPAPRRDERRRAPARRRRRVRCQIARRRRRRRRERAPRGGGVARDGREHLDAIAAEVAKKRPRRRRRGRTRRRGVSTHRARAYV